MIQTTCGVVCIIVFFLYLLSTQEISYEPLPYRPRPVTPETEEEEESEEAEEETENETNDVSDTSLSPPPPQTRVVTRQRIMMPLDEKRYMKASESENADEREYVKVYSRT